MVLVTSVFLTQLLCLIVPCDPQYKLPDTKPVEDKEIVEGWSSQISSKSEEELQQAIHEIQESSGHQPFIDVQQLKSGSNSFFQELECQEERPFATTTAGIVEGYRIQVVGGRKVCAFEGVPFADAPVGHLRFKPPVPKTPWKGILKANKYGPRCMQYTVPEAFRVVGKEDCLYLNVYTVSNSPHVKLPVIVFIHGGGFFFGSPNTYGPTYFMQRDIVLVTIQYRLGVLGFFSTGDSACPGNAGLKDQTMGLKWVHENIEFFGGDKHSVTIMGQSAGSAAVHLHMLSHSSRKYFKSAVSISGTAFNYWSFFDPLQTRNLSNALAKRISCPTEDSQQLVDCFRERSAVELVAQTPTFLDDWPYPANAFKPSIEIIDGNPEPFLTDFPENIYRRNEVANVPWLVTTVSGEGYTFLLFPFISFEIPTLQRNWYDLALDLVDAENLDIDRARVVKKLTRFYFKNEPPEKASVHTFAQIVTDRMFLIGLYEAARAHTQVAPTYSYLFDYNGKYNQITNYGYPASEWGVGHTEGKSGQCNCAYCSDLFYMYNGSRVYSGFQRGDVEYDISRIMVNMISNFAAKGAPVFTNDKGEDVQIWEPHQDPDNLNFLGISKYIGMIGDPFKKRINFWRKMRFPDTPLNVIVGG